MALLFRAILPEQSVIHTPRLFHHVINIKIPDYLESFIQLRLEFEGIASASRIHPLINIPRLP